RFLSPDRVGGRSENPQTWNRYAYALNGPIRLLDANGRQPTAFQEASTKIAPIADAIATTAEAFAAVPFQGEAMSQAAGLVGLAAQTLNLGTATGEAIGMGADAFTLTNAIASDVLTASLFTFVAASGARAAGIGGPQTLYRGFGDEGPGFAPGKAGS